MPSPPTAVAESRWHSEAFGTDTRVAGSSVTVAGPAAPLALAVLEAVDPDSVIRNAGYRGSGKPPTANGHSVACSVPRVMRM